MRHPYLTESDEEIIILALLAKAIGKWNNAEGSVRELLAKVNRDKMHIADWIIVYELGSRSMIQALQTLAHDVLEPHEADLTRYAADFYDRLLPYRNYYIHSFSRVFTRADFELTDSLGIPKAVLV